MRKRNPQQLTLLINDTKAYLDALSSTESSNDSGSENGVDEDAHSMGSLNEFGDFNFDPAKIINVEADPEKPIPDTKFSTKAKADLIDRMTDSLYLALSMIDFGTHCANNTSDAAGGHDYNTFLEDHWSAALLTIIFMLTIGIMASKMANIKKMQWVWPYFRDLLSGLKNGRHAFINVFFIVHAFSQSGSYHLFNPIGIAVGCVLAPALIAYRRLDYKRNDMIIYNETIIKRLAKEQKYNPVTYHELIPKRRSDKFDLGMLFLAGFNGLTDGSYLFSCITLVIGFGILNTVTMGTPLIVITALLTLYAVASMICKVYEEYQKQRDLSRSADEVEIAKLKHHLQQLDSQDIDEYKKTQSRLTEANRRFTRKYQVKPGQLQAAFELKQRLKEFNDHFTNFENSKVVIEIEPAVIKQYKETCNDLIDAEITYIKKYLCQPKTLRADELNHKIVQLQKRMKHNYTPLSKYFAEKQLKLWYQEFDLLIRIENHNRDHQQLYKHIKINLSTTLQSQFQNNHDNFTKLRHAQANHIVSYNRAVNPADAAKALWYMWRGILTAVKNIKKIGDTINSHISKLVTAILKIIIILPMIIYAKYYLDKERKKHSPNQNKPYEVCLFKKPACVMMTRKPPTARPLTPR